MRRPVEVAIPTNDLAGTSRAIEDHLRRLYNEAADHRNQVFYLGALNHGQTIKIGGAPTLLPSRSRHFIELSIVGNILFDPGSGPTGAAGRSSINVKLFSGGSASGNTVFDLTVGPVAGTGFQSGTQRTISNPGREVLDTTVSWGIVVTATGGAGNAIEDITVSLVYEDYSPYFINRRTTF